VTRAGQDGTDTSRISRRALAYAHQAWQRFYWIIAALVTLMCLSVFWSHATPHLCYDKYWLSGDSGIAVYNSWQVADGRLPYRDFFEYRTPLYFYLLGGVFKLTGASPAIAHRLTIAMVCAAAAGLAAAARRLGASRVLAVIGSVAAAVIAFSAWPFPLPPWLCWLFVPLAILALARAFRDPTGVPDRAWLGRAGGIAGLYVMTMQSSGLCFAAGATIGLWVALPRRHLAASVYFVLGGVLTSLPFVIYFAVMGVMREALWHLFVWTTKYYYNGALKGHYPFAGTVEYWQRRGLCKLPHAGSFTNAGYTVSVAALTAIAVLGFFCALVLLARPLVARVRAALARREWAPSGSDIVLAAVAGSGFIGLLPQIIYPEFGDLPHTGFAEVAVAVPLIVAASRGARAWKIGAQSFVWLLFACALFVSLERMHRWQPYQKRFNDYDAFVKAYAGAALLEELSEPGDNIVHMSYGGWHYLTAHRHSGVAHTAVFNGLKYTPQREFDRMVRNIRERKPTLMVFDEKGHEQRFFGLDPTLKDRYFWNGAMWELRDPPLPHDTLAPSYAMGSCGGPGDVLAITQNGPELHAVQTRPDKPPVSYQGSIRGSRVFLKGGSGYFLLHRQPDGALVGELRGGRRVACRIEPPVPPT
jgi:hypothetical protein